LPTTAVLNGELHADVMEHVGKKCLLVSALGNVPPNVALSNSPPQRALSTPPQQTHITAGVDIIRQGLQDDCANRVEVVVEDHDKPARMDV